MQLLVVEDEEKIAQFIRKGLKEEGYRADVVGTGQEALALALRGAYDLMVLDLMLPDLSGLEVIKTLRSRGRHLPILVLTALNTVEDKVKGLDVGADDYVTKPFAFEEFLARIRTLLRKTQGPAGTKLHCGDLKMDLKRRRVTRNGQEINLSIKEYSLLEFLLHHKDQVVDRDMISQYVWDMDFTAGSNYIDVHINRLRKKIDDGFPLTLIRTVRGTGYMISTE